MTLWRPSRREVLWTVAAVPAAAAAAAVRRAAPVQFSNIKFELGEQWVVATPGPRMILQLRSDAESITARIEIDPASPFSTSADAAIEAAWTAALAGRAVTDAPSRDRRDLNDGATFTLISQQLASGGGRSLGAVIHKGQITKLVMVADTDVSSVVAAIASIPLFSSLEVVGAPKPELTVFAVGANPADGFNWSGPKEFVWGIYDHGCRSPEDEFNELVFRARGFAGAVRPRTVTFADAVGVVNRLMQEPAAKGNLEAAAALGSKDAPGLYTIGAGSRLLQGDPLGALAQMGVALAADPTHPGTLFGTASLLAHIGMPNESLAVLDQLAASGRKPSMPIGLNADGAIAHVRGYAQMLRGELGAAETSLLKARSLEPILTEATHTLSVVQAAAGRSADGLATYREGMYRRMPTLLVNCESPEDGPWAVAVKDHPKHCRPPIDQTYDTSHGIRGELPYFNHPGNTDDLDAITKKVGDEIESLFKQAKAARPGGKPTGTSPYDVWAGRMCDIIQGLEGQEPLIRGLKKQLDACRESTGQAIGQFSLNHLIRLRGFIGSIPTDQTCEAVRGSATSGINQTRPHANALDTMSRRYVESWYRMATGLAAHIGDPQWHAYIAGDLKAQLLLAQGAFLGEMLMQYKEFYAPPDCGRAGRDPRFPSKADPALSCPEALRGAGLKFSFKLPLPKTPSLGFKLQCEKITVELSLDLAKIPDNPALQGSIGPFAQLELASKGQFTVFAGVKESFSVVGTGESAKEGFYLSGNRNGIDGMGVRTSGESFTKSGDFTISSKTSALDWDYSFLPTVPAPSRGPGVPLQPFVPRVPLPPADGELSAAPAV